MRIHDRFKSTTETSAKPSRFNRFKDAAREKNYYARNVLVGTMLATTAMNMLSADAVEKQQVSQTPETSTTIDSLTPVAVTETMIVAESGPSLRVNFPDMNTNFNVATPESTQFVSFLQNVSSYTQNDPSAVVTFSINGSASDEDRSSSINGDSNLGLPSVSNERLARDYADMAYRQLGEPVNASPDADAFRVGVISSQEAVLDRSDQQAIETIAAERGLSRYALLGAYNDKTIQVDGADALTLTTLIDDNRGATITTSIERTVEAPTEQAAATTIQDVAESEARPMADTPHRFALIPFALPLRMRRRKGADLPVNTPASEIMPMTSATSVPIISAYNPAASAVPAVDNYNQSTAMPQQKQRMVERMPSWLRQATRPVRHQISYTMNEYERKKSGRAMDRSEKALTKRIRSQLREKPSLARTARDFKHDITHAFRSHI